MRYFIPTILAILISFSAFSQFEKEGYTHIYTIKQPYHSFNASRQQDTKKGLQKINGMTFSQSQKYLVVAYSQNPCHVAVYKVGTWERVALFQVIGNGIELNNSYFDEEEKKIYLRYERFNTSYKELELETGNVKTINCTKTPKGCNYEEITQDLRNLYTSNKKFFIEVSPNDASDLLIFIKKRRGM